jgi:predicted nucleic acid-binding protein
LSTFLLDASVWAASDDRDNVHYADAVSLVARAASGRVEVTALDLTLYEVANVAVVQWKSEARATKLARLVEIACGDALQRVDGGLLDDATELAAEHGLSVYDAAYVVAARRSGARLVSADIADLVRPGFAITPAEAAGA